MANLTKALKRALGDDVPPAAPVQSQPVGLHAVTPVPPQEKPRSAWLAKLFEVRVPLLACVGAAVLAGVLYLYFDPDAPGGGTVYKPSSVPGPVASVVPPPGPAPGPSPTAPKLTPVVVTTPVPPSTPAPAFAGKPDWCSEDHLKPDELTICASESLWAFDNQLNDVFRKVSDRTADQKAALSEDEGKWVHEIRRPCGTDRACIANAYRDRISYLTASLRKQ
jgi:uncharacterized protein YecT (DUF1311 family)